MSYDQKHMTSAEASTVRFFDTSSLKSVKEHKLKHNAEAASYCASKGVFVAGGDDMWVHLYDFNTGEVRLDSMAGMGISCYTLGHGACWCEVGGAAFFC